jgi:NAD(P)-dependent dehydrogenase (short-subunit alcohol dehydrogenase family)
MTAIEDLFSLAGRSALVTGSSRGIGRAMALGLAAAGARVVGHGVAASVALDALGRDLAATVTGDLATGAGVDAVIAGARDAIGTLDILVLNASIEVREPWHAVSDDAFARQVAANLDATRKLIAAFVPAMAKRGWGRVLAIGSVQEVKEHPQMLVYAALKQAQTGMMRNLARQLAGQGVTCNTLAPGAIETDRNAAVLADDVYRAGGERVAGAGRLGTPDDCVGAALLLCSDAGRYITGERLLVDGGMHL